MDIRKPLAAFSAAALTLGLAACSGNGTQAAKPGEAGQQTAELKKVSIVLDWTPNTNHTGVFVAMEKGFFKEAGLEVEVKGYSKAGAESVLANGGADFAFSYASGLASAITSGNEIKMVYNLQQKSSSGIAVRADSKINGPKDLDGKVFASGSGAETGDKLKRMIIADGGKGEFETVIVGIGAYEAVANGQADFAEGLTTWEGIEFELRGEPLRFYYPADYGIVQSPAQMGIATSNKLIAEDPELVQKFVSAAKQGFDFALENPKEAAEILVKQNPEAKLNPELALKSQEMLSKDFWRDARGKTGFADLDRWQAFLDSLVEAKLLTDAKGEPVSGKLDPNNFVTNQFVK